MSPDYLTLALPKGTLFKETLKFLKEVGFDTSEMEKESRKLLFIDEKAKVKYIVCRPTDIPTFVEYGSADLGFVGKDTIMEQKKDVYELLDLKYGYCRFAVAMPRIVAENRDWREMTPARVATKFPRIAEDYFRNEGRQMEIIKLHGNIELAPMVGLAEMIVDLVSSGRTLKENDLVEVAQIFDSTTRLIANRVSHRLKFARINPLLEKMRDVVLKGV